jgi:O-acetylserine/cysteine efflux transporter
LLALNVKGTTATDDNEVVTTKTRNAYIALTAAGLLWGLTVPLSKAVLDWLDGGWLTVVRFALAAPLLALVARRHLRGACTPAVLLSGAMGYGLVIVLQNAGIERTSVSHAALIVGAVPALVALATAASGRGRADRRAAAGFALALAGVGIVAGGGGGAATPAGDLLVLASAALSATFVVVQADVLKGRDPVAVTAVQMLGGALAAVPNAAFEGLPHAPHSVLPVLALAALLTAGTLGPYALFAYGQASVAPELAGAFLNLEPLVGAAAGALAFGDPFGGPQLAGAVAILMGIGLSTRPKRTADPTPDLRPAPSARRSHGGRVRVSSRRAAPLSDMTLLAPRPDRTSAPRVYATPVVREVPCAPAATGTSSSAW